MESQTSIPSASTTCSGLPPANRKIVGNQSVMWISPYDTRPISIIGEPYKKMKLQSSFSEDCFKIKPVVMYKNGFSRKLIRRRSHLKSNSKYKML